MNILRAKVFHKRFKPKVNEFTYSVFYILFPLSKLSNLKNRFFSINKFNLFSLNFKDHGAKNEINPADWGRGVLNKFGVKKADGEIYLLTYPRVLGYVFNPVSFYFCEDNQGNLRAVIAEVNNTFGETHSYLIKHEDERIIEKNDEFSAEKIFHVSPFFDRAGGYKFRFVYETNKIAVFLDYHNGEEKRLATSLIGEKHPYSTAALLKNFFKFPFVTLKTIILIHFQALKIIIKGAKYHSRPKQLDERVS